jgi:hypothetical protein
MSYDAVQVTALLSLPCGFSDSYEAGPYARVSLVIRLSLLTEFHGGSPQRFPMR